MSGVGKAQLANCQEGELREIPYSGPVDSLTPFELAIAFPGYCGFCGKSIPFDSLFCNEHTKR